MKTCASVQASRLTKVDHFFRFACLIFGIQTNFTQSVCIERLAWVLWSFELVFFSFSIAVYYYLCFGSAKADQRMSFVDMSMSLNILISIVNALSAVFSVMREHDKLEALLQRHGRSFRDIIAPLLGLIVELTGSALNFTGPLANLPATAYMITDVLRAVFFMIYTDIIRGLSRSQEQALKLLSTPCGFKDAIAEKWSIRNRINVVNSIFGRTLPAYYLLSSTIAIFTVSRAIMTSDPLSPLHAVLMVITLLSLMFQLFVLAYRSDALKRQSLEIEYDLLKRIRPHSDQNSRLLELLVVFRFRDDWDNLQIGCFVHDLGNYVKFLASLVTFIAVILQFDYRVVRDFSTMTKE